VGSQGSEKSPTGDFILDAGALIALERGDRRLVAILGGAAALDCQVVIPASVLAQIWRGGSRPAALARLVDASAVDPLSEERAKEVGVRLGLRAASDVADAHVVCCAVEGGATIVTSDGSDIQALVGPDERLTLISV
jgi:predicted nucleic acid-binding protein